MMGHKENIFKKIKPRETRPFNVRFPVDILDKVDELAKKTGTSPSRIIISLIQYAINLLEEEDHGDEKKTG